MKKLLTYIFLFLLFYSGTAQKMAYVDTKYILNQMPQYQQAQQRLDNEIKKWQTEIQKEQSKLDQLRVEYENEKILLTDDQQKNRLSIIDSSEIKIRNFIDKKFGSEGDSFRLRMNFVKPLQDQIWNAINTVASRDKYGLIFDKSSDLIMVFTDPKYDITDKVLKQMGLDAKQSKKKESQTNSNSPSKISKTEDIIQESNEDNNEINVKEKSNKKDQTKSGYGSKYVPKKKKQAVEIQENGDKEIDKTNNKSKENKLNNNNEVTDTAEAEVEKPKENPEVKKATTAQPKKGYGSKYVPKKKTANSNK